jgi:hypothetical protein
MKKTIAALALATVVASPALAQSYDPSVGTGNIAPQASVPQVKLDMGAHSAYAQVRHGAVNQFVDHSGGATDPDPSIRFQLNRESEQGRW